MLSRTRASEAMQYEPTAASAYVAQAVLAVHARLRPLWPIAIGDSNALAIGVCGVFTNASPTIDLVCHRRLGPIANVNLEKLAVNSAEFTVIMKHLSVRGATIDGLETSEWFRSRKARTEKALLCTLAEAGVASAWQKPGVQLAVVLTFQCKTPPLPTLDEIFGAVIRSDSRRVEDLHYECLHETPDPESLCKALEILACCVL